jgi:hypothetical protein
MSGNVKKDATRAAAWLSGAGITAIIGYLIATVSTEGKHPSWPYLIFTLLVLTGFGTYVIGRRNSEGFQPGEIVLYSSGKSSLIGHDFTGNEARIWEHGEHVGDKGRGKLRFAGHNNEIMNIIRINNAGKYEVRLRRYMYQGSSFDALPGDVAISGKRLLRVSCEAKTTDSPHKLIFGWKPAPGGGYRLDEQEVLVTQAHWIPIILYFKIDPAKDCYLRIDDYYETGATPSTLQIRRIEVAERTASQ